MMSGFLALYLDGPMQSWGYMSKFDQRTSLAYPTKSGVTGMICAAMGIPKSDTAGLAEIAKLKMTVYVLAPPGRMKDFHTVGGGFDRDKSLFEKQSIVRNAENKIPPYDKQTRPTNREYLLDAKFAVIISGDSDFLAEIKSALQDPKWGIWLGRKSCVPTVPIYQGCYDTMDNALEAAKSAYHKTYGREGEICRTISEVTSFEDGSDSFMDIPVDFAERKFSIRRVSVE